MRPQQLRQRTQMANVANLLDLRFVNEANVFNYGKLKRTGESGDFLI
jgi:hypothetical protein